MSDKSIWLEPHDSTEIVRAIASVLGWFIEENENGISAYPSDKPDIRVSNYRNRLNGPFKISVVIEDDDSQEQLDTEKCNSELIEYIYKSEKVSPAIAETIAFDLKNAILSKEYANNAESVNINQIK